MANTALHFSAPADPELAGHSDLASDIQDATTPGAEEVGAAAVSVAVTYPDWRREELARKYNDDEPKERYERSFYHPYD